LPSDLYLQRRLSYFQARFNAALKDLKGAESHLGELVQSIQDLQQDLSLLREQITELSSRNELHGMDIYIQDIEPDIEQDHIWINTDVDHFDKE